MVDLKDATRLGVWAVLFFDENNPDEPLGTALTPQIPPVGLNISQTQFIKRVDRKGGSFNMASTPIEWEVVRCRAQWAQQANLMNTAAVYMRKIR